MRFACRFAGLLASLALLAWPAFAAAPASVPEHSFGKKDAPITVQEYVSLTCPHCAEFYTKIMPELDKAYIQTGKVRFVLRPFPREGTDLKAFALAECMPEDEYFPFIDVLYQNQASWISQADPEKLLLQYAKLGGLSDDKANTCLSDAKLQEALVASREEAEKKFKIEGTPAFIINDNTEKVDLPPTVEKFKAVFNKLLAAKHVGP